MYVLALDVSTHLGWALVRRPDNGLIELISCGRKDLNPCLRGWKTYPWNYLAMAHGMALSVDMLLQELREKGHQVDEVSIEETNGAGRAGRYDLKILEFTHMAILQLLHRQVEVTYISTPVWRRVLGIRLSKEEKAGNAALSKAAKKGKEALKAKKAELGRRGKIDVKNLAVRWARETYGLDLLEGDDDIAEACAIGTARLRGAELCTGSDRKPKKAKS